MVMLNYKYVIGSGWAPPTLMFYLESEIAPLLFNEATKEASSV